MQRSCDEANNPDHGDTNAAQERVNCDGVDGKQADDDPAVSQVHQGPGACERPYSAHHNGPDDGLNIAAGSEQACGGQVQLGAAAGIEYQAGDATCIDRGGEFHAQLDAAITPRNQCDGGQLLDDSGVDEVSLVGATVNASKSQDAAAANAVENQDGAAVNAPNNQADAVNAPENQDRAATNSPDREAGAVNAGGNQDAVTVDVYEKQDGDVANAPERQDAVAVNAENQNGATVSTPGNQADAVNAPGNQYGAAADAPYSHADAVNAGSNQADVVHAPNNQERVVVSAPDNQDGDVQASGTQVEAVQAGGNQEAAADDAPDNHVAEDQAEELAGNNRAGEDRADNDGQLENRVGEAGNNIDGYPVFHENAQFNVEEGVLENQYEAQLFWPVLFSVYLVVLLACVKTIFGNNLMMGLQDWKGDKPTQDQLKKAHWQIPVMAVIQIFLLLAYVRCFRVIHKYAGAYKGPSRVNMFTYINIAAFMNQAFAVVSYVCGSAPAKVMAIGSGNTRAYLGVVISFNVAIVVAEALHRFYFSGKMTKVQRVQLLLAWTSFSAAGVTRALDSCLPADLSSDKASLGIIITFGIASLITIILICLKAYWSHEPGKSKVAAFMLCVLECVGTECSLATSTFTADAVMTRFDSSTSDIELTIGSICLIFPSFLAIVASVPEKVSVALHVLVDYISRFFRPFQNQERLRIHKSQLVWKLLSVASGGGTCMAMVLNYHCWATAIPSDTSLTLLVGSAIALAVPFLYGVFVYRKNSKKTRSLLKITDADIPAKSLAT